MYARGRASNEATNDKGEEVINDHRLNGLNRLFLLSLQYLRDNKKRENKKQIILTKT